MNLEVSKIYQYIILTLIFSSFIKEISSVIFDVPFNDKHEAQIDKNYKDDDSSTKKNELFKYNEIKKPDLTKNFMYSLSFKKYLFSTVYESAEKCGEHPSRDDEGEKLYAYIIISENSDISIQSDIIVILKCIFKELQYTTTAIKYVEEDTFCSKINVQEKNVLFIYLHESQTAIVSKNDNGGYKSGIKSVEDKFPCAFLPSGDGKVYVSLNVIGKVYKYSSYSVTGEVVTKYGQHVTFLDEKGMQDHFLATSSDSSAIDLKPFIEISLQTDTGYSYFTKKSSSIKDVLHDLFDAITFMMDTPNWFKSQKQLLNMLPTHRYTELDIKSPKSEYIVYKEKLKAYD
uniref:Secreted ookinete protein n=1 Tax=Strongyloides papillosus TaxID=174720 RepID=A0A0N5CHQ5_STREA